MQRGVRIQAQTSHHAENLSGTKTNETEMNNHAGTYLVGMNGK